MREGWTYKKLGEVCKITSGFTPKPSVLSSLGKYPYFKVADMNTKGNEVYLSVTPAYVDNTKKTFPSQSIVFPKNGATIATNKKRILAQDSIVDLNTAVAIFSEVIIPKYSFYWFTNIDFREYTRGGALPTLDLKLLKDSIFPFPPIPQQRLIVSELDEINSLLALKREQLKKYDELAQSLFYEMFGDPVENEKGWEVKMLGEIANFKNGLNFEKDEEGYRYKFLGVSDFKDNYVIQSESLNYISLNEELDSDYFLETTDIVFVRSNGSKGLVGRCVSVDCREKTTFSGFCIRCRIIDGSAIESLFLLYICKNKRIREYLTQSGRGCNISNVNQKILNSTKIILPPLSFQQTFAQHIEQIEEQKKQVTAAIAKLETLLASRMQYWFE